MSVVFTRTGTNIDGFMDEKTNQCKRPNQKGLIGPGTPRQKSNPDRGRMCLYTIAAATNDVPFQKRRKPISMYYMNQRINIEGNEIHMQARADRRARRRRVHPK